MNQRAYTYSELGGLKDQILQVCQQVSDDNPTAWRQAHNGNFDETSTRYNDLCVQALRAQGIYAGCNGKRGGEQRSDDVLAFGLSDGRGAQDRSGRFTSMAIIDYIAGAGGPNPSLGWGDVSASAPGRFLDPQGLGRIDGNPVQPPAPPAPPAEPGKPPTPTPVDHSVLDAIRALTARLDAIPDQIAAKVAEEVAAIKSTADETYHGIFRESDNPDTPSLLQRVARTEEKVDRIQGGGAAFKCNVPKWRASGVAEVLKP